MTLAMLVIGGTSSLWGAVVGALFVSGLDSLLAEMEGGVGALAVASGMAAITYAIQCITSTGENGRQEVGL